MLSSLLRKEGSIERKAISYPIETTKSVGLTLLDVEKGTEKTKLLGDCDEGQKKFGPGNGLKNMDSIMTTRGTAL